MKSVLKVAICGVVALAMNSAIANGVVAQKTVSAAAKTQAGRSLLRALGVSGANAAELNAAIARLSATDSKVVLAAIKAFEAKADLNDSAQNGASLKNEQLAREVFAQNNVIKIAANAQTATAAQNAGQCDADTPRILAEKAGYPEAAIASALKSGALQDAACGKLKELPADATKVLALTADCANQAGVTRLTSATEVDNIYATCLQGAFKSANGADISKEDALTRVKALQPKKGAEASANDNCPFLKAAG